MSESEASNRDMDEGYPDYDNFLKYRETLSNLAAEQSRSFDKNLTALASGGIALSLLLLKDVLAGHALVRSTWLYSAWGLFCASLVFTLLSFQVAKMACDEEIRIWDELYRRPPKSGAGPSNKFTPITTLLNWAALVVFGCALVALFVFGISNVK